MSKEEKEKKNTKMQIENYPYKTCTLKLLVDFSKTKLCGLYYNPILLKEYIVV